MPGCPKKQCPFYQFSLSSGRYGHEIAPLLESKNQGGGTSIMQCCSISLAHFMRAQIGGLTVATLDPNAMKLTPGYIEGAFPEIGSFAHKKTQGMRLALNIAGTLATTNKASVPTKDSEGYNTWEMQIATQAMGIKTIDEQLLSDKPLLDKCFLGSSLVPILTMAGMSIVEGQLQLIQILPTIHLANPALALSGNN